MTPGQQWRNEKRRLLGLKINLTRFILTTDAGMHILPLSVTGTRPTNKQASGQRRYGHHGFNRVRKGDSETAYRT